MRNKRLNNNLTNSISKGGVLYRAGEIPALTKEQTEQARLVSKLPKDFPFANWESMNTKQQLQQMKHSGLNDQDLWSLLNTNVPLSVLDQHNQAQDEIETRASATRIATTLMNAVAKATAAQTSTPVKSSSNNAPLQSNGLRQKLDILKEEVKKKPLGKAGGGVGAAAAPKAIGKVTGSVGIGLVNNNPEENKPNSAPTSTPLMFTIETVPPTPAPRITPTPSPKPTPTPTPKPTANLDMINQLVIEQRNQKNPFYLLYSQKGAVRSDCSTQATDFYAIKGEKSPFYGIVKDTCLSYYDVFHKLPSSFLESGGMVWSSVPRDVKKGASRIPDNWQETAQFGDIAIWMEDPKYDKDGRLLKDSPELAWHMAICTDDAEMIDRAQWKENNPNGFEEGLFVRGLDTIKSSYKLIMIISPGDEARLTPDDIYYYLLDQQ